MRGAVMHGPGEVRSVSAACVLEDAAEGYRAMDEREAIKTLGGYTAR